MLSQPKIDLAVLYKLHQHADGGGEAITPDDVSALFAGHFPLRRVQVALDELGRNGEVEREYHPFYSDEGLWQISRDGMRTVDRALAVPASFIARLHANGDHWLVSDEANDAILNKKTSLKTTGQSLVSPVSSNKKIDAIPTSQNASDVSHSPVDWTKWGTILTAVGLVVTIVIWMLS